MQCRQALIKCGQAALLFARQSGQIGVGDLPVTQNPAPVDG